MYTIPFVDNREPFTVGFQIGPHNINQLPPGRIRIARFSSVFNPTKGYGYYAEIYFRRFIRIWYNKVVLKRRKKEKIMALLSLSKKEFANQDILRKICEYI